MLKVALVQVSAGPEPAENAARNLEHLEQAAAGNADFVLFPEVCNLIEPDRDKGRPKIRDEAEDETLRLLGDGAKRLGVWVLVGSVVVRADDGSGKLANRSVLFDEKGRVRGRYDKMHLFDVDVGAGDVYRESDFYSPGTSATLTETPWGPLGMTVCYDLRFPHLYRDLAKAGAVMMTVPSAFTRPTGEAHWEVLLRARAIENGAFILAPAQTGEHAGGRKTYGHSLVVGPWGEVQADGGLETGVTILDLDLSQVSAARHKIPALKHDRSYTLRT